MKPSIRQVPSHQRRLSGRCGFTLIELLVVIVILGVLATGVAFTLGGSARSGLRYEAERLRLLLEMADTEARRTGSPIHWRATESGYTFLRHSTSGAPPASAEDARFRPRVLPEGTRVQQVQLNGQPIPPAEGLLFRPGLAPLFSLELNENSARITLDGRPDGSVVLREGPSA